LKARMTMDLLHRFNVYVENKLLDARLEELERHRREVERLEKLIGLPTTRETLCSLEQEPHAKDVIEHLEDLERSNSGVPWKLTIIIGDLRRRFKIS
jgi:hypothetical protein